MLKYTQSSDAPTANRIFYNVVTLVVESFIAKNLVKPKNWLTVTLPSFLGDWI